ncbi:hypothetical protein PIROE2DRAFT_16486 [Piromyces sp. E2]|nr:hypothetical protein PIROE2DRAFT_16486 [Piromyces sp. E2]|eukprot:OUM58283.1 hypothetical protein PIROE2DRAFT_16486 [Piromyces sp. E2]
MLKYNNTYDLNLKYIDKIEQNNINNNTNCGDPYINYIFVLRKNNDYKIYKIKNSTDLVKINKQNNEITEKNFININNNTELNLNEFAIGIYLIIYQTDTDNNIKTFTAEKALEIFEKKINEKQIKFYPNDKKTTRIYKPNCGTGIYIYINQSRYMISAYWHPLKKHAGIIGKKVGEIITDIVNVKADAGYWAIAVSIPDNQYGFTYYRTFKENKGENVSKTLLQKIFKEMTSNGNFFYK